MDEKTFTMKKIAYIVAAGALLLGLPANAQDIYKVESLAGEDLRGTARFVGMGGAMSSLGADISVMGTNPAGIGMYRSSDIAVSGSVNVQPNAEDFYNIGKSRASFDQIGFVYAAQMGNSPLRFVNFGFNYHKRRNFKNFIGVDNFRTGGLSQTLEMLDRAYVGEGWPSLGEVNPSISDGWLDLGNDRDRGWTTPLTCLGYDTQLLLPVYDEASGELLGYEPCTADSYNYKRVQWGGIQQYDFNMSFNWKDRVYGGLTFGVYNVDMHSFTDYGEMLIDPSTSLTHEYYLNNEEALSGNGFDFKFGLIFRPFEYSPFRFGIAVHTPTYYTLEQNAYLYMNSPFTNGDQNYTDADVSVGDYEYKIRTPWSFNISMATTVGNFLALDAEYEYRNYASSSISYNVYDYDYWYDADDVKDPALNNEISRFMKPVSTVKVGAEARLSPNLYLRLGYNYVSAPLEDDAYLNLFTSSDSYYYSTNTDYVNLGSINRVTCGLGYRGKHFYADVAYQYQAQQGDLYTFHVPAEDSEQNRLSAATVDMNRHNVMFTLGYKF